MLEPEDQSYYGPDDFLRLVYADELCQAIMETDFIDELFPELFRIASEARAKYGTDHVNDTRLFHVVASSSLGGRKCRHFDLPGEDSFILALERAAEKLVPSQFDAIRSRKPTFRSNTSE